MELVVQFVNFHPGFVQSLPADRRNSVNPPLASAYIFEGGPQQAAALQTMQERVERSRANAVAVMRQLLHHGQSKDGLVSRVHQHVHADESGKELSLFLQHKINIPLLVRFSI
jgi:hypothetical protein